jgi:uncharacterized repeat protein (TIGR01451 family)
VDAGANLTYTLTVSNAGPDTASNVSVTDVLPRNVTFVSVGPGCSENSGTVTCTAASLANAANVAFTVTVTAPSAGGTVNNAATVTSIAADSDESNDTDAHEAAVNAADLSITKTASPIEARVDQNFTYTLTVTNNGPSTATSVSVVDTLSGTVTFVEASGTCSGTTTLTCLAASIANGANAVVTITVTAPSSTG